MALCFGSCPLVYEDKEDIIPFFKKSRSKPGVMADFCIHCSQAVEAGVYGVQSQLGLKKETLCEDKIREIQSYVHLGQYFCWKN